MASMTVEMRIDEGGRGRSGDDVIGAGDWVRGKGHEWLRTSATSSVATMVSGGAVMAMGGLGQPTANDSPGPP